MTTPRHDPLTPDERALADRLARLGPHDGPSPALDARILAAAHRAVAGPAPARRGWRGWLGTPASLVTAVGTAATLALAIGVVWQLRPPVDGAAGSAAREAAAAADGPAVVFDTVPSAPRPMVMPPPPAAETQLAEGQDATTPRDAAARQAADAASQRAGARAAEQRAAAERAESQARERTPAAPAPAPAAASVDQPEAFAGTAADAVAAPAAARRPSYTNSARAVPDAPVRASAKAAAPEFTGEAAAASSLDRIEVTGTRIRAAGEPLPPLHEDSGLDAADWLERVRARRDAGELDDARESLVQFRKAHPRVRIPDDLAALLQ
ncbi:hypothetical protein [Cognatilysobacter tabacisoli]|uniref:hypothetical protein n=1 Tax=Cognatilysobacter tabacisoli TaxID=2315424 RepID=UPI000E6AE628|nr:hypothetical protein [Lysobacter tabacisoli]